MVMRRLAAVGEPGEDWTMKGYPFESEIRERLEKITSSNYWCETLTRIPVQRQISAWRSDLVVATEHAGVVSNGCIWLQLCLGRDEVWCGWATCFWVRYNRHAWV